MNTKEENKNLLKLISPYRFDLMAKLLYLKYPIQYYSDLYLDHIKTFNNFWEYPGTKTSGQDFIVSFNNLIKNAIDAIGTGNGDISVTISKSEIP